MSRGGSVELLSIDQSGMRRVNTEATLRALFAAEGASTSAELVDRTGLSRRTLDLILGDLMAAGWVTEVTPALTAKSAGRPKKYYRPVPDRAFVTSVVVNDGRVRAYVADVRGTVLGEAEGSPAAGAQPRDILHLAVEVAAEAIARSERGPQRLVAVSVGVGGTVSPAGVILTSPVDEAWVGVDVGAPFAERFGVPVTVENDTNLATLAEHTRGAARDVSTFVLLTPGNRVSAGVVIDGQLYRGFQGAAGELIRLPGLGVLVWHEHPVAMISSPEPERRERARDLLRRADQGDAAATALVEEFFASLGPLVAVIGWVLAPPVLVIGGAFHGLEELGHRLLGRALAGVDLPPMQIRMAALEADAPLIGGVRLALNAVDGDLFRALP